MARRRLMSPVQAASSASGRSAATVRDVEVLFVCGGNACLSAAAEVIARAWVRERLAVASEAAEIKFAGAGLTAASREAMERHCAGAVQALGGDPDAFRSRPYRPELAEAADLVLTMTRDQRREVLAAMPRGLTRTFTLAEAAGLLALSDRAELEALPYPERARGLSRHMHAARAHRPGSPLDDLPDPVGRRRAHRQSVSAVATALGPLVDVLVAPVRAGAAAGMPGPAA
jgi:protein-tyrosine phosphatase